MPATRFVCYFSGTRRGFSATCTTTRFVSRARWHHNTPRLPRARYKKLSVRSNASYPGSGDALAAQRETRPVSAALFLRCRERTTREKRFSRRADPSTTNRHDEGPRGADLRSSACLRRRAHEGRRKNCPLEAPRPVEARGSTFLGFWVFGFLGFWVFGFVFAETVRLLSAGAPERAGGERSWNVAACARGFARGEVARETVARRTSGRRASRLAGFAELLPVVAWASRRRVDCAARITDAGGFSPRAPRAGSTSAPTIAPGSIFRGFWPRAPRARAARRPRRGHAGPRPPAPPWFFGPGSVPSARASRAGSPAPSASAAAAVPGRCRNGAVLVARRRCRASGLPYGWPRLLVSRRRRCRIAGTAAAAAAAGIAAGSAAGTAGGRLAVVPLLLGGGRARAEDPRACWRFSTPRGSFCCRRSYADGCVTAKATRGGEATVRRPKIDTGGRRVRALVSRGVEMHLLDARSTRAV